MKHSRWIAAALGLTLAAGTAPARADSAFPTSIAVYPYPVIASPSKYPITVDGCGVSRLGHRLHVGFSFKNLQLDPMTAVKISVDLYDPFKNLLTTLDSTINGDYSPGAEIQVPEFAVPGDTMPAFETWDHWPTAASAVCYVSSVAYGNGDVWNTPERPSLDVASHALDDMTQHAGANAHAAVQHDLAQQRSLGYRAASIAPAPLVIPDGWKTVSPGMYVDARLPMAGLHLLSFVSLTGAGGNGPLKASDIPTARDMEAIDITDQHATTICGDEPAQFLALRGTTSTGPQIVEAIKVRKNGVSYVSSYTHSIGAAANRQAEDDLTHICY